MTRLTKETEGYSASDLRAVCNHAAMAPIRELGPRVAQVSVPTYIKYACVYVCVFAGAFAGMDAGSCIGVYGLYDEYTSALHVCLEAQPPRLDRRHS